MEGYKLLIVFFLMIGLLWRRVPLIVIMLSCSTILAFLFNLGLLEFIIILWRGVSNPVTFELAIILILIMMLELLLRREEYLNRMLIGLQAVIPNPRFVLALLPSFIGMMPSAGGAIFSAPLVEHVSKDISITPEQKSFINYYYRHVTEYFLPLAPAILLASNLAEIPVQRLILNMIPYGILAIWLGIPVLKKVPANFAHKSSSVNRGRMNRDLIISTLPILAVVFLVLVMQLKVWLAVGMVMGGLLIYHHYTLKKIWVLLSKSIKPKTILLVLTVMIFKQVLEDTNAVSGLPELFSQLPIPLYLIFCAINFLISIMTGHMIAVVAIGFPIAIAAMGSSFNTHTTVLLFIAGFTGQMLTPLHLCLSLTIDYFRADLKKVIHMLIVPEVVLLFIALTVYNLL